MKVAMLIISTMLGILVLSFKEVIPSGERAIGFDRIAPELRIRKGLPDFFKKASRGDSVRVAYLSESIPELREQGVVLRIEYVPFSFECSFSEIQHLRTRVKGRL